MVKESYTYINWRNKPYYYFESEGEKGKIPKIIIFTHQGFTLWNLAFGDLDGGDFNDSIVSNNHDIVKIMSTIAEVVYDFSAKFPSRHILIDPVDEKRRKLYNHIFRRNYEDINHIFHIKGFNNGKYEDYSPKKMYESFKLKRKFA